MNPFVSDYSIYHELSPYSMIDILINISDMSQFKDVLFFPL